MTSNPPKSIHIAHNNGEPVVIVVGGGRSFDLSRLQQLMKECEETQFQNFVSHCTINERLVIKCQSVVRRWLVQKEIPQSFKTKKIVCSICYELFQYTQLISHPESNCQPYCKECLANAIFNHPNITTYPIMCPSRSVDYEQCRKRFSYSMLKEILEPKDFEVYDSKLLQYYLSTNNHFKWCPQPDCGMAFEVDSECTFITCLSDECRHQFCVKCSYPAHPKKNCSQIKKKYEKDFQKWVSKNTKPCPKCKVPTEKSGACNHMSCWYCKYEWCWLCGSRYTGSHFSVYNVINGCPGLQDEQYQNYGKLRRIGIRVGLVVASPVILIAISGKSLYRMVRD